MASVVRKGLLARRWLVPALVVAFAASAWFGPTRMVASDEVGSGRRAVIYVMPSALDSPGSEEGSTVVVDSAHNGRQPQVAKIYEELQHNKNCQPFSANMEGQSGLLPAVTARRWKGKPLGRLEQERKRDCFGRIVQNWRRGK
jgi:hypothetical protein